MTKKQFIQQIIIRALPEMNNLASTLQYAEQLWEKLSFYGYGADKETQPRESKNYYQLLTPIQRTAFDKFWTAFKYKKGRNEAAMRWWQMGELSVEDYQKIIDAAKQEALRPLAKDQSRKMAQGWLFERRYEDFTPDPMNAKKQHDLVLVTLKNELANLKNLYKRSPNQALASQINHLEEKINQFLLQ